MDDLQSKIDSELHEIKPLNLFNPDFENAGRVHDWRNHVPEYLITHWCELTAREREIIACIAQEKANNEHWD